MQGMQNQKRHICFFSRKCDTCILFLKELDRSGYLSEFVMQSVDGKPRSELPRFLKKVPTIVVKEDDGSSKTLEGEDCVNWLFTRKMREQSASRPAPAASVPSQAMAQVAEVMEFNQIELGGGREMYSFIDEEATGGNGSARILKNYDYIAGPPMISAQGQMMSPPAAMAPKKSKKEEMFDAQFEAFQRDREMGMPKARPRQ
jgi:hypothetical protein